MNKVLRKVKDIRQECCVSILLNTHRTIPDNEKDPILLKNLLAEAKQRLIEEFDRPTASEIHNRLDQLAKQIDHRHNLESLALFVNKDLAVYTRLPFPVTDRVVLGNSFATRDLIRSLHHDKAYYILVLSRDKARLIEAFNDKVVREAEGNFPVENVSLYPSQRSEAAIASRQTNLVLEFFNQVDKQLNEVLKEDPGLVFLCTDEPNYHQYLKVADDKELFMGYLAGHRLGEAAHHIVTAVWPSVLQYRRESLSSRGKELESAAGTGRIATDFNDIWRAANEGRGQTLFVQQGYYQPARLKDGFIEVVDNGEANEPDVVEDIIDDIIEIILRQGGDCVFLSEDILKQYNGLALSLRY